VAIAGSDRLSQLLTRLGDLDGELLSFTEADWLPALEAIVTRRPKTVALERLFAASPRGAALITRIKTDKRLNASEIKVFAHDSEVVRIVPRADAGPQALDQRGTRRAARVKIHAQTAAIVEGKTAMLVDLSVIGAQIVSPAALKPNQEVSFALVDKQANLRFKGTVAWTSFEIPPNSGPQYRAGIQFVDADPVDVDAFAERHKENA
jgi:hypothetical protein